MDSVKLVVIGGSAGSLDVLLRMLPALKPMLNLSIILVLHRKSNSDTRLIRLLEVQTTMKVKEVEEKEQLRVSTLYIAPPDYHVLLEKDGTFSLDYSEKENFSRPSIDVTFQSAAEVYKSKLVCLLLSGSSMDGVAGLEAVKYYGGIAAVQDPATAAFPFMPQQAILNVKIDRILSIEEIPDFINRLAKAQDGSS